MSDPPQLIDERFEVLAQVGSGGMGTVYRVRDRRDGRVLALKMLAAGDEASAAAQHRFKREFRALARLSHPNIVAVHDHGTWQGRLYFSMDFVEGRSLRELADHDRPLARTGPHAFAAYLKRLADLFCQILDTLDYVHRQGIVHRDMKPTNVLVTADGSVRVMDFGLAWDVESSVAITRVGTLMGTVAYMSPEQAQGRRLDHRADLYSVGIMLYELATGERPFAHANPVTLVRKHIVERPLPPTRLVPELPEALEAVILRLLEKDPVDRYATAGEAAAALREPERAARERATATSVRPGYVQTRFVGRDAELQRLDRLLDEALRGRGCLALISGEAGVGKTRLIEELKAGAFLEGFRFLRGACHEKEGLFYQPFAEVIAQYNHAVGRYDLEWEERVFGPLGRELARLVPALAQRTFIQQLPEIVPIAEAEEKLRRFDAVTRFLANVSRIEPLLLLLDDLHWSDELTRELLRYLCRSLEGERILVVVTWRSEEMVQRGRRRHPLEDLLQELEHDKRAAERMELRRLSAEDVQEMVSGILGSDLVPDALLRHIQERTGGNPFMIEEILRVLLESGAVKLAGGAVQASGLEAVSLPDSVADLVERRLSTLGEASAEAISAAAVIGVQFEFDVLQRVLAADEDLLLDILDELLRLKLVVEVEGQGDAYEFTHPMVREVLYNRLNRRKRKRLHRAIAQAMQERARSSETEGVEALAYHFRKADEPGLALPYEIAAGVKALGAYANEAAIAHFEAAVDSTKEDGSREGLMRRRDLYSRLLEALDRKGRWEDALRVADQLLHVGQVLEQPTVQAEAHRRRGQILHRQGRFDAAMQEFNLALHVLADLPEGIDHAQVLRELARAHFMAGDVAAAESLCRRAMTLSEADPARAESARLHNLLAGIHRLRGGYDQAVADYERAYALFQQAGDHRGLLGVLNNLGMMRESAGDVEAGIGTKRKGLELARRIGDVSMVGWLTMSIAASELALGRWSVAEDLLSQAEATAMRIGDRICLLRVHVIRGRLASHRGDFQAAQIFLEKARRLAAESADAALEAATRISFAHLWRRSGKLGTALAGAMEVERSARAQGNDATLMDAVAVQAEIHRDMGNHEVAFACITEALTLAAQLRRRSSTAELRLIRGTVLRELDRGSEAERDLAWALEEFTTLQAPHSAAIANLEHGVLLLRDRDRERQQQGVKRVQDALAVFQRLGAQFDAQRARRELARLAPLSGVGDGASALAEPPWIGHAAELARLEEALGRCLDQREGAFFVVTGETGLGKTRLLDEIARRGQTRGAAVLSFSFRREGGDVAGSPFAPLVRDCLAVLAGIESREDLQRRLGAVLGVLLRLLPELISHDLFTGIAAAVPLSPAEERFRMYDALQHLLAAVARSRGALVLLDDLHRADEASLGLLHYLIRNLRDQPVLAVATADPQERAGGFGTLRQELLRERLVQGIELSPFRFPQTTRFVQALLGTVQDLGRLPDMIWEKSEGNPLFARELVRTLVQSGLLSRATAGAAWQISDAVTEMGLPRTLADVIAGRFAAVEPAGLRLLELAAVLGREFEFELLQEAVRQWNAREELSADEDTLVDLLDDLIRRQLLEECPVGSGMRDAYRFVQGKFQDVLLDRLAPEQRRRLHAAAGRALELVHLKDAEAIAAELAQHFAAAQDLPRAVRYARLAGQRAQALYANAGAVQWYESVLEWVAANPALLPPADRVDVLSRLSDVLALTGQTEEAVARLDRALALAQGMGVAETQADLLIKLARCREHLGQFPMAVARYHDALALLRDRPDSVVGARAWLYLGWLHYLRRDLTQAQEFTRRAQEITDRLGDKALLASLLNSLGIIATDLGRSEEALAHLTRAERIHTDLGDKAGIAVVIGNMARVMAECVGQSRKAHALLERALALDEEIGHFQAIAGMCNNVGRSWLDLGDGERAREFLTRGLELSTRLGNPRWTCLAHTGLGQLFLQRGEWTSAGVHLERALRMGERFKLEEGRATALMLLAELHQRQGRPEEAGEDLRRALDAARATSSSADLVRVHAACARFRLHVGAIDVAAQHVAEMERWHAAIPQPALEGLLRQVRGMVSARAGRSRAALADLTESAAIFARLEHPFEQARALVESGIVLARESVGAGQRAMTEAHEIFVRLGARAEADDAHQALERLEGGAAATSP